MEGLLSPMRTKVRGDQTPFSLHAPWRFREGSVKRKIVQAFVSFQN